MRHRRYAYVFRWWSERRRWRHSRQARLLSAVSPDLFPVRNGRVWEVWQRLAEDNFHRVVVVHDGKGRPCDITPNLCLNICLNDPARPGVQAQREFVERWNKEEEQRRRDGRRRDNDDIMEYMKVRWSGPRKFGMGDGIISFPGQTIRSRVNW